MAERGNSLLSATAQGVSGTIITALAHNEGMYYVWVKGHSACVRLLASPDATGWFPVTSIITGASGAAHSASGILSALYGYLRHDVTAMWSAGNAKPTATTFIQMKH